MDWGNAYFKLASLPLAHFEKLSNSDRGKRSLSSAAKPGHWVK